MKNMYKLSVGIFILAVTAGLIACKKPAAPEKPAGPPAELTVVRAAIQAYYGDHEGKYPATLAELAGEGKYFKELPKVTIPGHAASNAVKYIQAKELAPENLDDAGGFAYYNSEKYPDTMGALVLNCTHKNDKGMPEYSY
jgi:hypothetical protein